MKKYSLQSLSVLALLLLPLTLLAQGRTTSLACSQNFTSVADLFNFVTCLISRSVIPLLFVVAIAIFIFGVVKYIANGADETKREEGRQFMFWGIIAFFVMVSIWGLVALLRDTFGVNNVIPQLQQQ
jgi:hypothetical protein